MLKGFTKRIFGNPVERQMKKYREIVARINGREEELRAKNDADLRQYSLALRERHLAGEALDDLLEEAFALVRETARRTIGLRHYDVQLIGGIALHTGKIAEMKTGEGKTLVATLPLYLNALAGNGAHLVTPNDYLSKVGLQMMGPIYVFLGLSAAVIQNAGPNGDAGSYRFDPEYDSEDDRYQNLCSISRQDAYSCDITYGTNNEFGFDYLRDNMVFSLEQMVQQERLNFAIVDEVDNILIDEARTPLIISGSAEAPADDYRKFARIVKQLKRSSQESVDDEEQEPDGDFVIDEKERNVFLTEAGVLKVERLLGIDQLYHAQHSRMIPYLDNCLRAQTLFQRDVQYVVQNGQVIIVDDFTGRLMYGRRFSEGLHQAIEAKEGLQVRRENMTLATITFQNFFRMYRKLAGMTGTAMTEAEEFEKIYELEVVAIPTHEPIIRADEPDFIYMTLEAKWRAVVQEIKERHEHGQPVLVGTVAIETSEALGRRLSKAGIPHNILNAKQHEREATIIAQAGSPRAVTIATNMAGRGVDILLGGNPEGIARERLRKGDRDIPPRNSPDWLAVFRVAENECKQARERVLEAGGLYVLGTERHDARRIDNQLRGRSGRQGDPGKTRFFLSLEDELFRRFAGDRMRKFMNWANQEEEQPLEHRLITKSLEQAQVRVEGHNFDIRKRVLDYDDVVNKQRTVIYGRRREVLSTENLSEDYLEILDDAISEVLADFMDAEDWQQTSEQDLEALYRRLFTIFPLPQDINPSSLMQNRANDLQEMMSDAARRAYQLKAQALEQSEAGLMTRAERIVMLRAIDQQWQQHLTDLDILREGIGLMAIAQRDPLVEYQREAFSMFRQMQEAADRQALHDIFLVQVNVTLPQRRAMRTLRPSISNGAEVVRAEPVRAKRKLGRNEPCWCGSGKKYKQCHLRQDEAEQKKIRATAG